MIKVLRIVLNPFVNGKPLASLYGVDPAKLHEEILAEWQSISGETYEVIGEEVYTNHGIKIDGFVYTDEEYTKVITGKSIPHSPDYMDYYSVLNGLMLIERRNKGEFDEVHILGGPWCGCYESIMIGDHSIWCNAPMIKAMCPNFVIMGFSYERGISEAMEAFGHRTESILSACYPAFWNDFKEAVGTIHIPHNGVVDYDWSNHNAVMCYADKYPDEYVPEKSVDNIVEFIVWLLKLILKIKENTPVSLYAPRMRNCEAWYCNSLGYFRYWYAHIPKVMWGKLTDVTKIGKG